MYSPLIIGGRIASNTAKPITIGVYILENLVINLSDFDFLAEAFSTKSKTLLTVESKYSFVTSAIIKPFIFIQPLNIFAPSLTSTGTDPQSVQKYQEWTLLLQQWRQVGLFLLVLFLLFLLFVLHQDQPFEIYYS